MKRRFFLKNTVPFSILSSLALSAGLRSYVCRSDLARYKYQGRALVLIQLDGGNDGLNTVIPLDQYAHLAQARKNIMIPDKKVLPLYNSAITGLHPAMGEVQKIYNNRRLSIIQGVGCSDPDLSHFRSIDIWHTGYDVPGPLTTGWLGRFLDQEYDGRGKDNMTDPGAVQIGSALSKALQGQNQGLGMVVNNTNGFYDLTIGSCDLATDDPSGRQLAFIRNTAKDSKKYLLKVKAAAERQKNLSARYPAPGANELADQLKIAAQLIGGGLQAKVYMVKLGGFDTHDKQTDSSDPVQGDHANLLAKLSEAMAAFEDDIHLMGKQDKVLAMTYSEFGRRIQSNASYGCDHGTAAPLMLFGPGLKNGLIGHNPQIPSKVTVNDNLDRQYDFRSVYTSVLKGWFGIPDAEMRSILPGTYSSPDLFV
jgi:uncharacterized protein (DUF1501 family)